MRAAPPRAGATRVVLVDGRSGAGKTALGAALGLALAAPVVSLEELYPGWDGLEAGVELLCAEVLEPLAAGRPVLVPRYVWAAGRFGEPWELRVGPFVVVEGAGCGAARAAARGSLLVWLELDAARRRERAFARDGGMYRPHWERWAAQEAAQLGRERTSERADVVLDTRAAEPVVVRIGRHRREGGTVSAAVSWLVEYSVKPGKLDDFRALAGEMVAGTKEEPGSLIYEFFLSDDGTRGHIYERYADDEATLTHFAGFGSKWATRFMDAVEITGFTTYGNPGQAVRDAIAPLGAVILGPLAGFAR